MKIFVAKSKLLEARMANPKKIKVSQKTLLHVAVLQEPNDKIQATEEQGSTMPIRMV